MPMPEKRLFSVNVGRLDEMGIPDPRLRARTDQAALAVFKLMVAAGLSGQLTPAHGVADGLWIVHIDVDAAIYEALELFEERILDPVAPEQAANRITDNAAREIRNFMQVQQPANLVAVERAAQRVQSQAPTDNPVISTLRREPGQKMTLTTRDGTLTLSLQGVNGERLGDKPVPIVCRIDKLGHDGAILKLPKGKRQELPSSVGRDPRLAIPAVLARKEVLDEIFARFVSSKEFVTLQVREVIDRKTGNVRGLQLEGWPE